MKVEFIVNSNTEISDELKASSALAKENKFDEAIELLKCTLRKIFLSDTSYPSSTYAKIIPYFQKAGRYSEIEPFSVEYLVPEIELKAKKSFSHKSSEMQNAFGAIYVSDIYKKMALCAKRENLESDEGRFMNFSQEYRVKYLELLELGEKTSLQLEYNNTLEIFGSDTKKWPDIFKRKFQGILQASNK
ncbi:hypothetical protein [Rheinheimera sp.]|uniref:hypothetical protein n=1 Tax=Rheinheimera sp. TaxID=1869214 RepID=UPI0027357A6F|nr:hypothetical protein [Rheinheimera sp.]MDP2716651.1 hypothetical protein [Rheinheimera sp.]